MPDDVNKQLQAIEKITQPLDVMHLAQLVAFSFNLPPLYFCREYQQLDDASIITQCNQRLLTLVNTQAITLQKINELLVEREYFEDYEARLRVEPLPED